MLKRSKNAYRLAENGEKIRVGTQKEDVFALPENAKGYREYIDAFYEASTKLSPIAVAQGVDQVAQAMQWDIVHSPDTIKAEGKTYYISNNGDDSQDGLSPETAWATTQKLWDMNDVLRPGDAVLFERGGEWRKKNELELFESRKDDSMDCMNMILAQKGVSYGAYGEGPKPILNGSPHDFADVKYWKETQYPNIYECTEKFWNPGIIALDHTRQLGRYDEMVAIKELLTLHNFTGVTDLRFDCSYFFEAETKTLYFCSERGNPGERFSSIEIGGRCSFISTHGDSGLIENFDFIYGGYGVSAGSHEKVLQLYVKNCIFRYLGGCHFGDIRVCGNAVEIYGPCDGFVVESCWIYQMADSGPTFQVFQNLKNCSHRNVKFIGNVIEYCHWAIEFNTCIADGENVTENVWHAYNVLRMGGYGFGSQLMQRTWQAALYNCFGLEEAKNVVCEKNILDRSTSFLYRLRRPGCHDMEFKDNVNIQYEGNNFATFYEEIKPYDETAPDTLKEACALEDGGVYIYLD